MSGGTDLLTTYIIGPFIKAWNLFFEFQLPEDRIHSSYFDVNETVLLCFIPVVGLVIGAIAYFISWFFYFIAGSLGAAIISPIVILIFIEFLTRSRDSKNLVAFLTTKCAFYNKTPTEESHHKENDFMFYYIFAGIFILRVFCLGVLVYYHHFGWLILVYMLSFAIEGYLAADNQDIFTKEELIHAGAKPGLKLALVTFILALIFGGVYFPLLLLAFIITGLIGYFVKIKFQENNLLNGVNIGMIGKCMEILLLILGMIYKIRF